MHTIEYELTFLAKYIPNEINNAKPNRIVDYYAPDKNVVHPNLRIRKNGDKYELTKKVPLDELDSSIQNETTIVLTKDEYQDLTYNRTRYVAKDRFKFTLNNHTVEVDIFLDDLSGLVLVDFEFNSKADMKEFTPPDYCLADVTQEEFVAGGILAGKSYQFIENNLSKFNYKKLSIDT